MIRFLIVLQIIVLAQGCAFLETNPASSLMAKKGKGKRSRSPAGMGSSFSENPNNPPNVDRVYEPLDRPKRLTKKDFSADANDDSSLWSDRGQVNFFFSKNKTRQVGDILTVNIEQGLRNEIISELRKNTIPTEWEVRRQKRESRKKALAKKKGGVRKKGAAAAAPEAVDKEEAKAEAAAVEKRKAVEEKDVQKENDIVNVEVLDRYDNGNYRVRGVKEVMFRGQRHRLEITAVVKDSDIQDDEAILSSKLYTSRVEYVK